MRKTVILLAFVSLALAYQVQIDPMSVRIGTVSGTEGAYYSAVTFENSKLLPVQVGEPALPGIVVQLALPQSTEIDEVRITYSKPVPIEGYYDIAPMPKVLPLDQAADDKDTIKSNVYDSMKPFPGNLVFSYASGNFSGYQLGNILFAPIQYIPVTGQLIAYTDIEFTITLKSARGDLIYPKYRLRWIDYQIKANIAANVINPDEIKLNGITEIIDNSQTRDPIYPYLIIYNSGVQQKAQDLAAWKKKKGLNTTNLTDTYIINNYSGSDTQEKIRNCIKDYYTNYGTQYVVLMSDPQTFGIPFRTATVIIPNNSIYYPKTDNYYGCLDGTWDDDQDGYWGEWGEDEDDPDMEYDVFVGRFDLLSGNDYPIRKTAIYEGHTLNGVVNPYNYENKSLLAGSWVDSNTNELELMNYIDDNILDYTFWNNTILGDNDYGDYGYFNPTTFENQLNNGPGIIAHGAHGAFNLVGTNPPPNAGLSSTQLAGLENAPNYAGFMYSAGCYTADPAYTNCARSYIGAEEGGGVSYIGNTNTGFFAPGYPSSYSFAFLRDFLKEFATNDVYQMGQTLALHKNLYTALMQDQHYVMIHYELYLSGDPDLWVHNDTIGTMSLTYDSSIPTGTQDYSVNVHDQSSNPIPRALVCIWKGNEVYASNTTDVNGDVTFNDINPTTTGTMYLTVSKHNWKTKEQNVTVTSRGPLKLQSFRAQRTKEGITFNWQVLGSTNEVKYNIYQVDAKGIKLPRIADSEQEDISLKNLPKYTPLNRTPIKGREFSYAGSASKRTQFVLEAIYGRKHQVLGYTPLDTKEVAVFNLKLFPQPAHNQVSLVYSLENLSDAKINVFDLSGRIVHTISIPNQSAGEHSTSLNLSSFSSGIYIVRLSAGDSEIIKRIVVAR